MSNQTVVQKLSAVSVFGNTGDTCYFNHINGLLNKIRTLSLKQVLRSGNWETLANKNVCTFAFGLICANRF